MRNQKRETVRVQIDDFIELLKLEATETTQTKHIHTHTQTDRRGGFYFRKKKSKKQKEENRNYFVVKDVIVNVYKVKTE